MKEGKEWKIWNGRNDGNRDWGMWVGEYAMKHERIFVQELRDELQKPKKKKFMTPERKKKLRQVLTTIHQYLLYLHLHPYRHHHLHPNPHQLLMREAAKQLKIEQEKKEAERRKVMIPISIP